MKTGFIFPGQGSQSVGMLSELADNFDVVQQTYAEASDVLNYDLWSLVISGTPEELNQTERTQPALLAAGIAVWRVWQQSTELKPMIVAGHSLGEYTALVAAGAIDFSDGVALVADRGRFMQQAVPAGAGAMAAILGLEDAIVTETCEAAAEGQIVACANYNSPGQIVIAGEKEAVERAIENLKAAGAKRAMLLPVSVPSHCELMKPAAEQLQDRLEQINLSDPSVPVLKNVDGQIATKAEEISTALIEQLYRPVRWVDVMTAMNQEVEQIIECGPGKVLAGLSKRIDRKMPCYPVFDPASLEKALTEG